MQRMKLKISKDDPSTGYLYLSNHPGEGNKGAVVKQIRLSELLKNYKGPDIYLDIDKNDNLIGIEILY